MPSLGPKQLPPRSSRSHTRQDRLLHSTTTLLTRAAKKALATRRSNAAKKAKQRGEGPPPPDSYLHGANVDLVVACCLRRIGLSHTGVDANPLSVSTAAARDVVEKMMSNPGMKKVLAEAQAKVTEGRVAEMRAKEGGQSKAGKKKTKKKKKKGAEGGTSADAAKAYTGEVRVRLRKRP